MIWPFWKLCTLIVVGETLAIGVNVWTLCDHWNDPWWSFVPKVFNLAALCGAATMAGLMLGRAYRMDREHKQWLEERRAAHERQIEKLPKKNQ